jgi:hypothetical protein
VLLLGAHGIGVSGATSGSAAVAAHSIGALEPEDAAIVPGNPKV